MKRVLDIGNCGPDHGAIADLLDQHFKVEVVQVHNRDEAAQQLAQNRFDLITVNRVMDRCGSSGLEIVEAIKQDAAANQTPVMLISNYESYQQQALALGAEPGFGKAALRDPATVELLRKYLD